MYGGKHSRFFDDPRLFGGMKSAECLSGKKKKDVVESV